MRGRLSSDRIDQTSPPSLAATSTPLATDRGDDTRSLSGTADHGTPKPTGFTAVNGDVRSLLSSGLHADDAADGAAAGASDDISPTSTFPVTSWRPAIQGPAADRMLTSRPSTVGPGHGGETDGADDKTAQSNQHARKRKDTVREDSDRGNEIDGVSTKAHSRDHAKRRRPNPDPTDEPSSVARKDSRPSLPHREKTHSVSSEDDRLVRRSLTVHSSGHREDGPQTRPGPSSTLTVRPDAYAHESNDSRHQANASQAPAEEEENDDDADSPSLQEDDANVDASQDDARADREQGDADGKQKKRKYGKRTKTGCHTCRLRKKKCGEEKPICKNCQRGKFACGGYGPKPPDMKGHKQVRNYILPSSKGWEEQTTRPPRLYQPPDVNGPDEARRSYAYRAPSMQTDSLRFAEPLPIDARYPPPYYPQPAVWTSQEHGTPSAYPPERPPPAEHHSLPPLQRLSQPALPPLPLPPPPAPSTIHAYETGHPHPPSDPWSHYSGHYRGHASRASITGFSPSSYSHAGSSARTDPLLVEKDKMLRGLPFKHWRDTTLGNDRDDCELALEAYNAANRAGSRTSTTEHERTRCFKAILDPSLRRPPPLRAHTGPIGSVGTRTIVASPFKCLYGYNLRLGQDCAVERDCTFQDAADIFIGNRVIIGDGVRLLCLTVGVDARQRSGSQGDAIAGAIRIEDDACIGAGATILAYRTIGKGAFVAAGAVVTKDVKPYTMVAGNPAEPKRSIDDVSHPDRERGRDAHRQNEATRVWMQRYVDNGFREPSQ